MSLSACNPDRGPEYTTPAEFGEVTVSPQIMSFDSEVRVKVSVSCPKRTAKVPGGRQAGLPAPGQET